MQTLKKKKNYITLTNKIQVQNSNIYHDLQR